MVASFPDQSFSERSSFTLRTKINHNGQLHEVGIIPDLVFGLKFADGSRRCFMVEIDRGTMPVVRSDVMQTSFERKMRAYLSAHAAKQHERQFGWKTFRVLTVTTDEHRIASMTEALRAIRVPGGPGSALFLFASRRDLTADQSICKVGMTAAAGPYP